MKNTFEELLFLAKNIDASLYGNIRKEDLFKYLQDEIEELKQINMPDGIYQRFNQIEEFGDVLFCLIAFAKQNDIDINHALSLTICKLQDRLKRKK